MAIPGTKNKRNMFDMLSLLQKAVRRGRYSDAGYAANELESGFRNVMWSRMLVISAEDCYGVLTKEVMALKEKDDAKRDNELVGQAIAIMCKAFKSRDACYFACNFVADFRNPRSIKLEENELMLYDELFGNGGYDDSGFKQMSMFKENYSDDVIDVATFHKAITHLDMDMIGYQMSKMRIERRQLLWDAMIDYATRKSKQNIADEIIALEKADKFVNRNRKPEKIDEIFTSKAVMILCYELDDNIDDVRSSEIISLDGLIDWSPYKVKPIFDCYVPGYVIPEWVFDCHTLKGKRMGKTDWDMTVDEQEALYPKKYAYFDNASWFYTYMQDVRNGDLTLEGFEPIKKYSENHEANPIRFIPYD